jgi:hypothetical protein
MNLGETLICKEKMVNYPTPARKFITLNFAFKREKLGKAKKASKNGLS